MAKSQSASHVDTDPKFQLLFRNMSRTPALDDPLPEEPDDQASGWASVGAVRALSHPTRVALLRHLAANGPATATECAPFAGVSPSNCSFHLRQLARYGLVATDQEDSTRGRRRLWRAIPTHLAWLGGSNADPDEPTDDTLVTQLMQQSAESRDRYYAHEDQYPDAWKAAAGRDQAIVRASAEELTQLRWAIGQLLSSLGGSRTSAPADAEPVEVAIDYTPLFIPSRNSGDADEMRKPGIGSQ
jgi:predicted transcriptional regulator